MRWSIAPESTTPICSAILLEPLTDTDKTVRIEAARAIGQVGGASAALLLRLRALLGKDEPEVLGAVYSALLSVEGARAIALVAAALKEGDDLAAEAAFALAETRAAEALAALIARLRAGADAWFSSVLLSAIALTRLPEAIDFLLALIAQMRAKPRRHRSHRPHRSQRRTRARVEKAVAASRQPAPGTGLPPAPASAPRMKPVCTRLPGMKPASKTLA